jgi:signal peptidase II
MFPDQRERFNRIIYFSIAASCMVLDQATKVIVQKSLHLHERISVIPGLFSISHELNTGAAFSLFANSHRYTPIALAAFSIIVISVVAVVLWKSSRHFTRTGLSLALILGGALGNFIDRAMYGHVVDFLGFYWKTYYWPDFNVADSCIVCGSILLIWDVLFPKKMPQTVSA